jgi:chloramphenicol 3-O phosphotransferase
MAGVGSIVVLNGVPRSGKSSIARSMQESFDGAWMNLGVDVFSEHVTPARLQPGIGLRPGGDRPDLEPHLPLLFAALYRSVIATSRLGLHVVVDVGHHDDYSRPLGILGHVARQLEGSDAYLIGVRCPPEVVTARRDTREPGREGRYVGSSPGRAIPDIVLRWDRAVHEPGIYDLEVDTSRSSPEECATAIRARLAAGNPGAFAELARHPRSGST